jgi:iron complex outermembrane receptor protein
MLQTYYDHVRRSLSTSQFNIQSFDIDFQHRLPLWDRHDITWGSNYRLYHTKILDSDIAFYTPQTRTNQLFSGFIRDDITLIPDRLFFTLGTRLDRNDFTGLEIQPNARLMWTPNTEQSIWMAVSRAVRTPSRAENDIHLKTSQVTNIPALANLPYPVFAVLEGNHRFQSEKLMAYEVGYRQQLSPQASVDISGFANDYSQLRDLSFGALSFSTGLPSQFLLPMIVNNQASALTYGVEVSGDWRPLDNWRIQGNYSFLDMQVSSSPLAKRVDPGTGAAEKLNPQHQFSLRSNYDLSEKMEINLWLRYTSEISYYRIPGYVTMDARLTYRPAKNVELFVVGQNLFSQHHREFVADIVPAAAAFISRGVYGGVQWRF